jgi:CBS domain-containing protein
MVQDVMTSNVLVVERHTGVEQVAKALANNRVSAAPVVTSADRVIGVVSESDLLSGVVVGRRHRCFDPRHTERTPLLLRPRQMTAGEVMTAPPVTVRATQTVVEAARIAAAARVRRLPVVDDLDLLVGIVTRSDLRRCFLLSDTEIRTYLLTTVLSRGCRLYSGEITADVADGVVTLRGSLEAQSMLMPLLERLRGVAGITAIHTELAYGCDSRAPLVASGPTVDCFTDVMPGP